MLVVASLIAMGSGLSAVAAGYLFGARRGVAARDELRRQCHERDRELEELRALVTLFEQGKVEPVIDAVVPFAEAAKGHARLEERKNVGKVVLVP